MITQFNYNTAIYMPIIYDSGASGPMTDQDILVMKILIIALHLITLFCVLLMYVGFLYLKRKDKSIKITFWQMLNPYNFDYMLILKSLFETLAIVVICIDLLLFFSWIGYLIVKLF